MKPILKTTILALIVGFILIIIPIVNNLFNIYTVYIQIIFICALSYFFVLKLKEVHYEFQIIRNITNIYLTIIGSIVVLLGFIIGIQSSVFSSHDKNNNLKNNDYNWFSIHDIFRFPIEQLKIIDKNYTQEVSINTYNQRGNNDVNLIVLDKTGSTDIDEKSDKQLKDLLDILRKNSESYCIKDNLQNKLNLRDNLLFIALRQIHEDYKDNSNTLIYTGNESVIPTNNDFSYIQGNQDSLCEYFKQCFDQIESSKPAPGHITNYTNIVKFIKNRVLTKNGNLINTIKNVKLTVIGDFRHEKDFDELRKELSELNSLKYNFHLHLIVLYDKNKYKESVQKTLDCFANTFNSDAIDYTTLYIDQLPTFKDENINKILRYSTSSVKYFEQHDRNESLIFYQPYPFKANGYEAKSNIVLKGNNFKDKILVLKSNQINANSTYASIDKERIYINQIYFPRKDATDTLLIEFKNENMNTSNLFLEIYDPNTLTNEKNFRYIYPIIFKETLSKRTSQSLIILYFTLFTTTFFIGISFILSLFKIFNNSRLQTNFLIILLFLTLTILTLIYFFTISSVNVILSIDRELFILLIFILILLGFSFYLHVLKKI